MLELQRYSHNLIVGDIRHTQDEIPYHSNGERQDTHEKSYRMAINRRVIAIQARSSEDFAPSPLGRDHYGQTNAQQKSYDSLR